MEDSEGQSSVVPVEEERIDQRPTEEEEQSGWAPHLERGAEGVWVFFQIPGLNGEELVLGLPEEGHICWPVGYISVELERGDQAGNKGLRVNSVRMVAEVVGILESS